MADGAPAGIDHRADRPARLHHRGAEPGIRGIAEEVAGAHDQRACAVRGAGGEEAFHLEAHRALPRCRVLRRGFADQGPGVGPEIIYIAGKDQPRARSPGGGEGISQHRQRERAPAPVAGRVGAMKNDLGALRGGGYIGRAQGVALDPFDGGETAPGPGPLGVAMEGSDPPALGLERGGDGAADAAGRADDERRSAAGRRCLGHRVAPSVAALDGRSGIASTLTEIGRIVGQLRGVGDGIHHLGLAPSRRGDKMGGAMIRALGRVAATMSLLLLIAWPVPGSARTSWQAVRSNADNFAAMFPGRPCFSAKPVNGTRAMQDSWAFNIGDRESYQLAVISYPPGTLPTVPTVAYYIIGGPATPMRMAVRRDCGTSTRRRFQDTRRWRRFSTTPPAPICTISSMPWWWARGSI